MSKPNDGFVSGHRFSDAANRHPVETPSGAACSRNLFPQLDVRGTRFFKLISMALSLAVFAAVALAAQSAPNAGSQPSAAAMQEKTSESCGTCHEARIIVQQRLSKPAWTKEVDKMTKWGAEVDPKDRDALIDYFSANFGPDQPPYEAQRAAAEPKPQPKTKK